VEPPLLALLQLDTQALVLVTEPLLTVAGLQLR
jgi:hypothetical protein